ncbi:LPS assembly lipoprotein LptE [Maridesulfovibrio zosterae]|uniref:LPS assembly lipoprotein LptE n=1 Tax=Maridesulfovibrio zosterae TaxID=82171 RepID=UPI0003F4F06B|nr:LPS assembly lipoprotein LptE [Maridesulfovibrio zosterae]
MTVMNHVKKLILLFSIIFAVNACGYHNSATEPNRLGEMFRDVAISKVENPTLERWLEPKIRSLLHDEIIRRGQLVWVDKSKADALFNIKIINLTDGSRILGDKDKTLKYDMTLKLQMRVTSAADGKLLWNSGPVSVTESYYTGQEEATQQLIVELLVRRLVDKMNQAY